MSSLIKTFIEVAEEQQEYNAKDLQAIRKISDIEMAIGDYKEGLLTISELERRIKEIVGGEIIGEVNMRDYTVR